MTRFMDSLSMVRNVDLKSAASVLVAKKALAVARQEGAEVAKLIAAAAKAGAMTHGRLDTYA
jgi:hypothetical protein